MLKRGGGGGSSHATWLQSDLSRIFSDLGLTYRRKRRDLIWTWIVWLPVMGNQEKAKRQRRSDADVKIWQFIRRTWLLSSHSGIRMELAHSSSEWLDEASWRRPEKWRYKYCFGDADETVKGPMIFKNRTTVIFLPHYCNGDIWCIVFFPTKKQKKKFYNINDTLITINNLWFIQHKCLDFRLELKNIQIN